MKMLRTIFNKKPAYKLGRDTTSVEMKIGGHTLYAYENFTHMSKEREVKLRVAYDQLGLGVRIEDLNRFISICENLINEGNFSRIGSALEVLKTYIANYVSERLIMEIGGWGIIVDDEPFQSPRKEDNEIKAMLLKEHKEVRIFFLNTALGYLEKLNNSLNTSSIKERMLDVDQMKEAMIREKAFLNLIEVKKYERLWKHTFLN